MRELGLRALLPQPQSPRRPRAAAVDPSPAPHASFFVLTGRTLRSLGRHAVLYVLSAAIVIAAQAAVVFMWHNSAALIVASVVTEPFFVAVVTAFTYADVRGDFSTGTTWLRVLERAWAVVLIGLFVDLIAVLGLESIVTADLLQKILGAAVIVVAVSLIFADVHATVVDDAEPWWLLVPRSFGASMAVAWQGATFARAIVLFVLSELLPSLVAGLVQNALDARHVPQAALWSNAIAVVLLLPFVQALCTMVYLDAAGYESKRS